MSPTQSGIVGNRLLDALPRKDRLRLMANSEPVDLVFAEVLAEPGERISHVFFPTASFISLTTPTDSGAILEVGLVGNEGMLGTPLVLGVNVYSLHALVQGAGPALRVNAAPFRRELALSPALRRGLKRYVHVVMSQLAQTAACNRFHLLEARLARWLLMTSDRAHAEEFRLTHEFLSYILGVRRVGVTKAATALQNRKLISYHRGNIQILDHPGLQIASCGCYESDKAVYASTMG